MTFEEMAEELKATFWILAIIPLLMPLSGFTVDPKYRKTEHSKTLKLRLPESPHASVLLTNGDFPFCFY